MATEIKITCTNVHAKAVYVIETVLEDDDGNLNVAGTPVSLEPDKEVMFVIHNKKSIRIVEIPLEKEKPRMGSDAPVDVDVDPDADEIY